MTTPAPPSRPDTEEKKMLVTEEMVRNAMKAADELAEPFSVGRETMRAALEAVADDIIEACARESVNYGNHYGQHVAAERITAAIRSLKSHP
jgi:hypothetical protein